MHRTAVQPPGLHLTVHDGHTPYLRARQYSRRRSVSRGNNLHISLSRRFGRGAGNRRRTNRPSARDHRPLVREDPDNLFGCGSTLRHDHRQATPVRSRNPPTESIRLSPRSRPPRNKGNCKTRFAAILVVWRAEGLPNLGRSMPVLPAVEGIQAHLHPIGRLRSAYIAVPALTHRHRRPTSVIGRIQILPYGSRPLFALAGSHSPAGH